MTNWNTLKAAIANIIRENNNQEITGDLLRGVLYSIVNSVGENATFVGIATPSTNPGTPDGPVFYLATTAGIYSNFGNLSINAGEAVILHWNNRTWTKKTSGFATQEAISSLEVQLENEKSERQSAIEEISNNLSEAIHEEATAREAADTALGTRLDIEGTRVMTVDEMINFNPIANEGGSYLVGYLDKPSRYVVTKEVGGVPVNVGILEILSDSSQHVYTQVFTTHFSLDNSGNLELGAHVDTKLFTYFRSFSIDSPLIDSGTWTKWEDISHYSDILESIAKNTKDIELLNANTGISEYPVFDEATAYAVGDVVLYEGLLKRFTSAHEPGAWDGTQVESWSERKSAVSYEVFNANVCLYGKGDYTHSVTLEEAIAAAKRAGLANTARVISYFDNNGANIAIFNSQAYQSEWDNTNAWFVISEQKFKDLHDSISEGDKNIDKKLTDLDNKSELNIQTLSDELSKLISIDNEQNIDITIAGKGFFNLNTNGEPQSSTASWYSEFIPVSSDKMYHVLLRKTQYDACVCFYSEANFGTFISSTLNSPISAVVNEYISIPNGANYMVVSSRSTYIFNVLSCDKVRAAAKFVERAIELIQQQIDGGAINRILGLTSNIFNPYIESIQPIQLYLKTDGTLTANTDELIYNYFIKIHQKSKIGKYYAYKVFSENELGVTMISLGTSNALEDGGTMKVGVNNVSKKRGYVMAKEEAELYLYVRFGDETNNPLIRKQRLYEIISSLVVTEADSIDYPSAYVLYQDLKFSLMSENVSNNAVDLFIVDAYGRQIGNKVRINIGSADNSDGDVVNSNYLNSIQSITYKLLDNSASDAIMVGEGWSGNINDGYSHVAGNTEPLEFSLENYSIGTKLLVSFNSEGIIESTDVLVSVGDSPTVKTYNGSNSFKIGVVANGGNLKFTPKSNFSSSITNISIQEINDAGEEEVTITVDNVYAQLNSMITAFWNVAIGSKTNTMNALINGSRNIAIGNFALKTIVSGNRNIGIGTFAMPFLTEAENNVAIGADTIYPLTKAFNCVGIGKGTLGGNRTAEDCVAVGAGAMGVWELQLDRQKCVAIGVNAGSMVTDCCTHIGYRAGANVAGARNTSIGYNSLAVGNRQTVDITGTDLTCVGSMAQIANTDEAKAATNSTAIGANTTITKSNQVIIGNSQVEEFQLGGKKIIFNSDGTVTWEEVTQ